MLIKIKKSKKLNIFNVIDPHFADTAPGARIDDYINSILKKLRQIGKLVKLHQVQVVNFTGDIFANKHSKKNSHKMVGLILAEVRSWGCVVSLIIGNHDIKFDRLDLWEEQPISVLVKSGIFELLDDNPINMEFTNGKKVKLRGQSYAPSKNVEAVEAPKGDCDLLIHSLHFATSPQPGMFPKYNEKIYGYEELSEMPPDIFLLGHIHNDYGITELNGKHFLQHGALMRTSSHDYNEKREVKIGFVSIDESMEVTTSEIALEIEPFDKVFSTERKKQIIKETERLESFMEVLSEPLEESTLTGEALDLVELLKKIKGLNTNKLLNLYEHYKEKVQ